MLLIVPQPMMAALTLLCFAIVILLVWMVCILCRLVCNRFLTLITLSLDFTRCQCMIIEVIVNILYRRMKK